MLAKQFVLVGLMLVSCLNYSFACELEDDAEAALAMSRSQAMEKQEAISTEITVLQEVNDFYDDSLATYNNNYVPTYGQNANIVALFESADDNKTDGGNKLLDANADIASANNFITQAETAFNNGNYNLCIMLCDSADAKTQDALVDIVSARAFLSSAEEDLEEACEMMAE